MNERKLTYGEAVAEAERCRVNAESVVVSQAQMVTAAILAVAYEMAAMRLADEGRAAE